MAGIVGNILPPVLNDQVRALQSTAQTLDDIQLRLASGLDVNSAIDDPQNFFTSRGIQNRANDLSRLLDGIGQNIRTIEVADNGIQALLDIIDNAEAFVTQVRDAFEAGNPPEIIPGENLDDVIANYLLANPTANDLGGGFIAQTFTGIGTVNFVVPSSVNNVNYLVVGGGGGGGSSTTFSTAGSGGGGAGGVVTGSLNVSPNQILEVTIGAGGAAGPAGNNSGLNGQDSSFATNIGSNIIGLGGGGGIGGNGNGNNGGSGGGGRGGTGGVALQPLTPQGGIGNPGGGGPSPGGNGGGGGGGAGAPGGGLSSTSGGTGGDGVTFAAFGPTLTVGGGGGGGGANNDSVGGGGLGGGGDGANDTTAATAGVANTGGGGGGGNNNRLGAAGGSGIVALSFQLRSDGGPSTEEGNQYSAILEQIDELVIDANYRGINLLGDEDLTTFFNEELTSTLVTEGIDASSRGLGLLPDDFLTIEGVENALDSLADARAILREYNRTIANDLNIIEARQDFTNNTINTLESASDDLVVADQNQLGAEFLATQTRQQIQFSVLSFAGQAQRAIGNLIQGSLF